MNLRLFLKLVVVLAVLLFMVVMGKSNHDPVRFKLMTFESGVLESAFMYFIFFAVGVITGGILVMGGGKSSSSSKAR